MAVKKKVRSKKVPANQKDDGHTYSDLTEERWATLDRRLLTIAFFLERLVLIQTQQRTKLEDAQLARQEELYWSVLEKLDDDESNS